MNSSTAWPDHAVPGESPYLTVVIPVFNEEENLLSLHASLGGVLKELDRSHEVIFVDDGSTDGSGRLLRKIAELDPAVKVIRLRRNFGQTAAFSAGFDAARGEVVVTMDADLQNDPADIPALLGKLDEGFDVVSGWRKDRRDDFVTRQLPSAVANRVVSSVTGVKLHDYGCSLEAYRAEVVKGIRLYGEMHRFIPAIANWMGVAVAEIPVNHSRRRFGRSKYGLSRTFHVILDLVTVKFLSSFGTRPLHAFGYGGLLSFAAGFLAALAGTLTVLVVYLTARELKRGRGFSLSSAALLAVSLLHVRNSHYGTDDILATLFLAASFLFAARTYGRGRPCDYLVAGLLGGLGVSTKYNAGIFVVAIVAAQLIRTLKVRDGSPWRHLLLPMSGLVSLVAFVAGTPYALLDYRSFLAGFMAQLGYSANPWYGQGAENSAIAFLESLAQGFGVVPLVLAAAGALLGMRRHPWETVLLLSTPLAYLLFMSGQRLFFARFAIPLLPYLALLAGYGIVSLGRGRGRLAGDRAVPALLLTVALLQPSIFSIRHDLLLGEVDTRVWTAAWIDERLPKDGSLAMESYAHLDVKFGWKGHQIEDTRVYWPDGEEGIATALSGEQRYIVVSSFGYGPRQAKGDPPQRLPPAFKPMEERGRLIAHFGPGPQGAEVPYALDDMYTPFWHLFDRVRPGPTVRIYEMPVVTGENRP
ncbi:MAG: glycosyltransferase [Chloroflexota bacterium]